MAGDLRVRERAVLEGDGRGAAGAAAERAIHRYGRLVIMAGGGGRAGFPGAGRPGCARRT